MSAKSLATTPAQVCLLGTGWFPDEAGGLSRYVRELHDELCAQGVSVKTVVLGPATAPPDSVLVSRDASHPLPMRLLNYAAQARLAMRGSCVLDVHFALYAALPILARRRRALVVHFHGPWAKEKELTGASRVSVALARKLERWVYAQCDRLVVLSDAFAEVAEREYAVPREKVRLVSPGVDLGRFQPVAERSALRGALGVGNEPLVVAVRRLVPRMGIDVLLEAWRRLVDQNARLVVIGSGQERLNLERQITALGLQGRVQFLGRVSDEMLPAWYAAADIAVVPTVALEGFGLIVLEALACGTPVITTNVGGLGEIVPRLQADLVVPAGEPDALAARLDGAFSGAAPLPSRERCRSFAEDHSWASTTRQVLAVYAEASSARARQDTMPLS